ncbi:hypothetical protein B0T26DRAFT_719508 [Lasiosphaeria miniovina]|uniref:Uncharacterized protein n=1 Tax=Lasiosphaeria miniovina TaxID=1954250 RepID=A0AA40DWA2_9PEZI|nr:uncharacterized protein B0T26DRAFT_719508 [Lasiosphaeria miniovina]KAK0714093.1 hypothetical protein B0T26DRAFT_719508 [Lasiosphaeria miniovina]
MRRKYGRSNRRASASQAGDGNGGRPSRCRASGRESSGGSWRCWLSVPPSRWTRPKAAAVKRSSVPSHMHTAAALW